MKTKNFIKINASTVFAQKLAKDALAKEEERIQKTQEISFMRSPTTIVFRIANIYMKKNSKQRAKRFLGLF